MLVVKVAEIFCDAHAVLLQLGPAAIVHMVDKLPLRVDLPADFTEHLLALFLFRVLRCEFVAVQLADYGVTTDHREAVV